MHRETGVSTVNGPGHSQHTVEIHRSSATLCEWPGAAALAAGAAAALLHSTCCNAPVARLPLLLLASSRCPSFATAHTTTTVGPTAAVAPICCL